MLRETFDHDPPFYPLDGPNSETGDAVAIFFEEEHPELDSRARVAIASLCSFNYK